MIKVFLLVLCLVAIVFATQISYEGYKVFSVTIKTKDDFLNLQKFYNEPGFDFWDKLGYAVNSKARIMVEPNQQKKFENQLKEFGIFYEIVIEDVERLLKEERATQFIEKTKSKINSIQPAATINFNHFWDLNEINTFLLNLVQSYPELISVETIGKSYEGRDIYAARISLDGRGTVNGTRPIMLIDAAIHAREWIAPMVATHIINELVVNSNSNLNILRGLDWIIVPVLNVDGYVYSHERDRMWRKTRSINPRSTCIGVDANRNFDYQWDAEDGASTNPCREDYRGDQPASESEVAAISNLMKKYRNTSFYVTLHSFGGYLLYPFGYDFVYVDNHIEHNLVGLLGKNALNAVNGYSYTLGNSADIFYLASGAGDDYAAGAAKIPLVYTMELPGGGSQGFDIPANRINGVNKETFAAFQVWANYVINK